jgi:hypothetical protein
LYDELKNALSDAIDRHLEDLENPEAALQRAEREIAVMRAEVDSRAFAIGRNPAELAAADRKVADDAQAAKIANLEAQIQLLIGLVGAQVGKKD